MVKEMVDREVIGKKILSELTTEEWDYIKTLIMKFSNRQKNLFGISLLFGEAINEAWKVTFGKD